MSEEEKPPEPLNLRMGADKDSAVPEEEMRRRTGELVATVRKYLPQLYDAVHATPKDATFMMTQEAFAAELDVDEYTLLGMFVRYAGLHGRAILIVAAPPADQPPARHAPFGRWQKRRRK